MRNQLHLNRRQFLRGTGMALSIPAVRNIFCCEHRGATDSAENGLHWQFVWNVPTPVFFQKLRARIIN
jgi:hypothetical protein